MGWGNSFQQITLEQLFIHMKKKTLHSYLIPYTNITLKWIIALYLKAKTITFLGENLYDFGVGRDFLGPKKHLA